MAEEKEISGWAQHTRVLTQNRVVRSETQVARGSTTVTMAASVVPAMATRSAAAASTSSRGRPAVPLERRGASRNKRTQLCQPHLQLQDGEVVTGRKGVRCFAMRRQVTSTIGAIEWDDQVGGHGGSDHPATLLAAVGVFDLEENDRYTDTETEQRRQKTGVVHRMITEAPDALAVCHVASKHYQSFDAAATTRAVAWLAKFYSTGATSLYDNPRGFAHLVSSSAEEEESLSAIAGDAVSRLRTLVTRHAGDFSSRDLIVLLAGFAQLGWDLVPELASRIRSSVERGLLSELAPQELVCAAWALGRAAATNGNFLSKKALGSLESCVVGLIAGGQLEASQVVQVAWGVGQIAGRRASRREHEWYAAMASHGHGALRNLRPREQATLALALTRLGLCSDRSLGLALLSAFEHQLRTYDLVSMNTMLKCFHLMRVKVSGDLLQRCEVRCLQCMSKCTTSAISDFVYRCVKMRHDVSVHTRVYVENTVNSKINELGPKDMALLMWSFAKLGHRPKKTFLKRLEQRFEVLEVKPQSLSLLIWAYAKLRLPVNRRFAEAHYYMVWRDLGAMNMQCLANILFAYGRLGLDIPKDLFSELMGHFRANLGECNSQNIANIMVSCARLGRRPDAEVLSLVDRSCAAKMAKFSSQGMSNILWSFVKLDHQPSDEFLESFQRHFGDSVRRASPQNVANVVWSFAQIRHAPRDHVMRSIFAKVEASLDTFSEQDVATLLWGCGKLKYRIPQQLSRKLQGFCLRRQRHFSLHDVSLSLWGLTQQREEIRPEVLQAMFERSMKHLDASFHAEAFVHVVWSLSVRSASGLNRGAVLAERYEAELLDSVDTLSGYDASKLLCSLSFLGCNSPDVCRALVAIVEARIRSYDVQQLQSILNAVEALDANVLGDVGSFEFNGKLAAAIAARYAEEEASRSA